ncbi:hypothetical protein NDU88_000749 [Pleurodeles waltl]|uniref:Uncharacterized protein n=1 Tax=Pleurodeles waltl TaxID=8319 RepID=A0AAV7Q1P7_PLEWA|nr:hypothetical protein NDU88_000749 [Pleurodeles waltl]
MRTPSSGPDMLPRSKECARAKSLPRFVAKFCVLPTRSAPRTQPTYFPVPQIQRFRTTEGPSTGSAPPIQASAPDQHIQDATRHSRRPSAIDQNHLAHGSATAGAPVSARPGSLFC